MLVASVMTVVVVLVAVGVASQLSAASRPYRSTVDRSFAALAAPLARQSDGDGAALRALATGAPTAARQLVFEGLDSLATSTAQTASAFDALTPPQPSSGAGPLCQAALDGRAAESAAIRGAVEGLLGGPTGTGPHRDQAGVAATLAAAAARLEAADGDWSACRRRLAGAPGRARLPRSVWIQDPGSWTPAALVALVRAMASSATLAPVHSLAVEAPALSPAPASTAGTVSVVPATATLQPSIVVVNQGNVEERDVTVTARAVPSPSHPARTPAPTRTSFAIAWGASRTLTVPPLPVTAGASYDLTVTVTPRTGSSVTVAETVVVSPFPTSVVLTASSMGPVIAGQHVTYSATVVSGEPGAPAPTGELVFSDDGVPLPGCVTRLVAAQASCTASFTQLGIHPITATFAGTPSLAPAASPLVNQTVRAAPAKR